MPLQRGIVIYQDEDASSPVSKQLRQVDENRCKITTPASHEEAQQELRAIAQRKRLRKKETETPPVVSEAHSASSESPLDLSKSEETQRAPTSVAEDPPLRSSAINRSGGILAATPGVRANGSGLLPVGAARARERARSAPRAAGSRTHWRVPGTGELCPHRRTRQAVGCGVVGGAHSLGSSQPH